MLRYLFRRSLGWVLMIIVATNLTYFLANLFLDPRANYLQLRPPRTPEQISRSLAQYNLSPDTPLLGRWWHWITDIALHGNWGYSPVGDSVNTASRLESNAKGGEILVSEVTAKAAHSRYQLTARDPISVKNREQPVPLFEVEWQKATGT